MYACNTYSTSSPSGSCQQITLQHWSAIDPDNAVPWLLLAGRANAANDATAEAAAFGQAAVSHRIDAYNFSLYSVTEPLLPNDATPFERWYLARQLLGLEGAFGSLQYGIVWRHCSASAMQDTELRQRCDALAHLLVSEGTTLLDLGLGIAVGARAGWPQAQVASLQQQHDALAQVDTQTEANDSDAPWGCDAVSRGNAYTGQRARLGELGALRDALDHSGDSVPKLAQEHRESVDTMMSDARRRAEQSSSDRSSREPKNPTSD